MKRSIGWIGGAFLAWFAVGCAASALLKYKASPDYPRNEQSREVRLPGLLADATLTFDAVGVAHVTAASEEDLMRAVGFLHARDRFFQMDLLRRLAAGRVSELVGEQPFLDGTTVEFDLAMRGWGFARAAERDAGELKPDERRLLEAYADGVQAALKAFEPLEYRLLQVAPEPWSVEDTFLVARLVAWSVTHNWHQEATRLVLALETGLDRALEIVPAEPWPGRASLEAHGEARPLPPAVVPEVREMLSQSGRERSDSAGSAVRAFAAWSGASNAWVVGGLRSASGLPILANDPHMTHMVPSLMYAQHLIAPGLDVIGATVPGIPYVLAGHNDRVAWGITSTVADTVDLCIEKADPSDPSRVLGPRGPEPVQTERVVIRVRDGSSLRERVFPIRRTRNGPAFNDLYPNLLPRGAPLVTIRWDVGSLAGGIAVLGLANRARDVAEFRRVLARLVAPVQTYTAADVDGNIALFAAGRVPIRRNHSGAFPVAGWLARYDWSGFIPADQMPGMQATGDAVFAHANNLMVDPTRTPMFIQVDSAPSYRYERILERLEAVRVHTVDTVAAVQTDVVLLRARLLLPRMLEDLTPDAAGPDPGPRALEVFGAWDGTATADSAAAAIFFATYREAAILALEDEVSPAALSFILSQRYSTNAVDGWFLNPAHPVWDRRGTPAVERRAEVLHEAFRRAVEMLRTSQGPDPAAWRWGRLHAHAPQHPFGGKSALADLVNLPESEAGGGLDSVWKSHFDLGHPRHPYRVMAGPVWRMVVDLADLSHARFVLDTGQSGWPRSPHYQDLYERFRRGEYAPLLFDRDEIERSAVGRWTLKPEDRVAR